MANFHDPPLGSGGLSTITDIRNLLSDSKVFTDPNQHYDENKTFSTTMGRWNFTNYL